MTGARWTAQVDIATLTPVRAVETIEATSIPHLRSPKECRQTSDRMPATLQVTCPVHVQDKEPAPRGQEREGAIDEVESWDEDGLQ